MACDLCAGTVDPGTAPAPGSSTVSSTDSLAVDLDTGLSSTLNSLTSVDSVLDPALGNLVACDGLANYLGADALNQAIPATDLVVRTGEDAGTWISVPASGTSSQSAEDLAASSWVLLDDLVSDLKADTTVPLESVLVTKPNGSSNTVTYVCLKDSGATLNTLSSDHSLDTFLYTDIMGLSSDLGLGYDLDVSTLPNGGLSSADLNTFTQAGSETDLSTSGDGLEADTNIATDGVSGLLESTSSTLGSSIDLVDDLLDPSLDLVDGVLGSSLGITSNPESSGPSGVSACAGAGGR